MDLVLESIDLMFFSSFVSSFSECEVYFELKINHCFHSIGYSDEGFLPEEKIWSIIEWMVN